MHAEAVMNEEMLRIQKMVAEGKISPGESVELLESVGLPSAAERSRLPEELQAPGVTEAKREAVRVPAKRGTEPTKRQISNPVLEIANGGFVAGAIIAIVPTYLITNTDLAAKDTMVLGVLVGAAILGGTCVAATCAYFSLRHLDHGAKKAAENDPR